MNAISPRTVMYSMILEVKFAYVVVRLFAYDLTSKHVPNKRVIRCTNKLPIVNMVMHCHRPIMQCALLMNINYNGYFTQWLRITQLRNESQSQTFLRNNISIFGKLSFRQTVRSAKCPFGKISVRQNVRSAKRPSAKRPFGKMSFGKMSFGKVSFGKMSGYHKLYPRLYAFRLDYPNHVVNCQAFPFPFY